MPYYPPIYVNGIGYISSEFKVEPSTSKYQTAVVAKGGLYTSNDYGLTWNINVMAPKAEWVCVSISYSGQYQTAASTNLGLYRTEDYGDTWKSSSPDIIASCISTSGSGRYQTVSATNGIFRSDDYGCTWSITMELETNTKKWTAVALSSLGQLQMATASDGIYRSLDYGNTWALCMAEINLISLSMAVSGHYQIAATSDGKVYRSEDYGCTWGMISTISKVENKVEKWTSTSIASFGKYQTISATTDIYLSSDYGISWTAVNLIKVNKPIDVLPTDIPPSDVPPSDVPPSDVPPSDVPPTDIPPSDVPPTDILISSIAVSSTGKYQSASIANGTLMTSVDYGVTWANCNVSILNWVCVAVGQDRNFKVSQVGDAILNNINLCNSFEVNGDAGAEGQVLTAGGVDANNKTRPARWKMPASDVVPASASSPGSPGQLAYDASSIYVCVNTNVWMKAALTTF